MGNLTDEKKREINHVMFFEYLGSDSAQICACGAYSFGGGDPCGCGAGWDNAIWTPAGYKFNVDDMRGGE